MHLFLKTGVTTAFFHTLGRVLVLNEALNTNTEGKIIPSAKPLISIEKNPSGPALTFGF